jgi:hypothetical protein
MVAEALPEFAPVVVDADTLFDSSTIPFGSDEIPDEMFTVYAYKVVEQVVRNNLNGAGCCDQEKTGCSAGSCTPKRSGGCGQ